MKKNYLLFALTLIAILMWTSSNAQQTYCTPNVGTSSVEPITSVVYAGIDNATDATIDGSPGLEDFTSIIGNVEAGGTQVISLQGNTNGSFTSSFTVFIDWNQNGTLNDTDEAYQIGAVNNSTGTDEQTASAPIVVPATAMLGDTRMRIIKNYNSYPSNPCATYTNGAAEDYTINVSAASCPVPQNVTVDATTETTATISWTPGGAENDWIVKFGPIGFDNGDASAYESVPVADAPNLILTGLNPATKYDFYVQALCGGVDNTDNSNFIGPETFLTSCAPFGDFVEGFDTTAVKEIPSCWNTLAVNSTSEFTNFSVATYSNASSAPRAFKFYNSIDATAEMYLISPQLTNLTDANHQLRFSFDGATTLASATLEVGTMADPSDTSTFTSVENVSITSTMAEYVVAFDNSYPDTYIAYKLIFSGSYATLYLDDVNWELIPNCSQPTALTVDELSANTADISWAAGAEETQWEVKYGAPGFDAETEGMVATVSNLPTQTQLTGLDAGTAYEFYVSALCSSTDQSDYSGPKSFVTLPANDNLCEAIALTFDVPSSGDTYSNVGATQQTNEPNGSCWSGTNSPETVWFSFVAPQNGAVTVTTDIEGGTLTDTHIAIYEAASDCNDLVTLGAQVGCDEDGGDIVGYSSVAAMIGLTGGATYYVQIDGYGSATGTFGINVSDDNPLSLDKFNADYGIQLYPNPVQSNAAFYVTAGQFKGQNVSVKITDLLGKTVYSTTKNFGTGKTAIQSNTTLGSGVYFLNLSQDGKTVNKRIIIK